MSLARNISYTSAGRQARPFERMVVRSNVRVQDSEAGADNAFAQAASFRAPDAAQTKARRAPTVPRYVAVLILGFAICMVLTGVLSRSVAKSDYAKQISALYQEVYNTKRQCVDLQEDLVKARDSSAICYYAAHSLHMTAVDASQVVYINAPETRPALTNALDASPAQMRGINASR